MKKIRKKIVSLFISRPRYPSAMVDDAKKAVEKPDKYGFFGSEYDPETGCHRFVTAEEVSGEQKEQKP